MPEIASAMNMLMLMWLRSGARSQGGVRSGRVGADEGRAETLWMQLHLHINSC